MSQKKKILEKKKREERLKKAEADRKRIMFVSIFIGVLIIAIIAGALIFDASKKASSVVDYSAGLDEDGRIKGVNCEDYVELCDLNALDMNVENYVPTQEEIDQYIESMTSSYQDLSKEKGVEVKKGDVINIDYIGSVDGVEYEGGNTGKNGVRVTLGAGDYPYDFEDLIMGHKVGETFRITIPFATDFENTQLAGQIVDYDITINGLYVDAEFNDEFVKKNFGDSVKDADDFINRYKETFAQNKFDEYVQKYIISESEVKSYPASYLKKMKKYMTAKDLKQFESANEAYQSLYQTNAYKDVYEMRGISKDDYKDEIRKSAETEVKNNLVLQGLFDKFGLSITDEDVKSVSTSFGFAEDEYEKAVERFGEPYLKQQAMINVLRTYLKENYNLVY